MSAPAQKKPISPRQLEKKGGYPAGRPVSSGPMPAKFPSRPVASSTTKKS